MEIDRRGFFGRMIGGLVAGIVAPTIPPIPRSVALLNTIPGHPMTAVEMMLMDDPYDGMRYLIQQKFREATIAIEERMNRIFTERPMQLSLFPPHIPQVPLEDGWAAWEYAEQLELFIDYDDEEF